MTNDSKALDGGIYIRAVFIIFKYVLSFHVPSMLGHLCFSSRSIDSKTGTQEDTHRPSIKHNSKVYKKLKQRRERVVNSDYYTSTGYTRIGSVIRIFFWFGSVYPNSTEPGRPGARAPLVKHLGLQVMVSWTNLPLTKLSLQHDLRPPVEWPLYTSWLTE